MTQSGWNLDDGYQWITILNIPLLTVLVMPRRNYLVRMRIAEVLSDGEWKSTEYIVDQFLTNGWSFINAHQIASICARTTGIEKRLVGKGRMFRLINKAAFAEFMSV